MMFRLQPIIVTWAARTAPTSLRGPMAGMVANATDEQNARLSEDVRERWQKFVEDGKLTVYVDVTTVCGR